MPENSQIPVLPSILVFVGTLSPPTPPSPQAHLPAPTDPTTQLSAVFADLTPSVMVNWSRWKRRWSWWCVQYRPTPLWFLYAALALAPWAGAERSGPLFFSCRILLALTCVTWITRCLVTRHTPALPRTFWIPAAALSLQAVIMTLNGAPHGSTPFLSWLPYSQNRSASFSLLPDLFLLLGTAACVIDTCRHSARRHELWRMIVFTGVLWASYGLYEKFRQPAWTPNGSGRAPFATFSYHANAASYLNLIWPLALGLFCARLRQGMSPKIITGYGFLFAAPFAAEMVNPSRAGTFMAALLALLALVIITTKARKGAFPHLNLWHGIATSFLLLLIAGAIIWVGGATRMVYRWQKLPGELVPDHHRWLATQGWFQGSLEAGFFGFGPNSFTSMARQFVGDAGLGWIAEWPYAHMDPLQTVMEWGWIGGLLWALLTAGSMVWAFRTPRSRPSDVEPRELRNTDAWMRDTSILALLGVLLHSLVDYPLQIMPIQLVCISLVGVLWSRHRWPMVGRNAAAEAHGLDGIQPANIISLRDNASPPGSREEPASTSGRDPQTNAPSAPAPDHSVTKNRQSAIP